MVLNAMRLPLTSALAIVLTAGGLAGQQAPPPFRVEVNYVEVDAMVTDRNDRFVDDLAQEDFQIFENGTAQNIASFSFVDLPTERRALSSPPGPDVDADVSVNARPRPGRLYLFVLDDLHTSPLAHTRSSEPPHDSSSNGTWAPTISCQSFKPAARPRRRRTSPPAGPASAAPSIRSRGENCVPRLLMPSRLIDRTAA